MIWYSPYMGRLLVPRPRRGGGGGGGGGGVRGRETPWVARTRNSLVLWRKSLQEIIGVVNIQAAPPHSTHSNLLKQAATPPSIQANYGKYNTGPVNVRLILFINRQAQLSIAHAD